jgi:Kef-type K+ transport system membrane component KefB
VRIAARFACPPADRWIVSADARTAERVGRVPSEHQLLLFWCQLLALVFAARALGALMRHWGQPSVVGELAAGLLLGPSVLGKLAPGIEGWLFPPDPIQRSLLAGVAWIGVFLLLVLTGLETDLALVRRLGRATARVATGSLLIPLAFGAGLGLLLPETFVGEVASRHVFALFMGTALSLSALPVIAKILSDLDLMRRNVAQALIAAAMVDDVAGWILLGIVSGLAQSGAVDFGRLIVTVSGLAAFVVFAFTIGRRGVDAALRALRSRSAEPTETLTVMLVFALIGSAITHAIGLEAVFGAFIAGIVLGHSRYYDSEVAGHLQSSAFGFFAPLFFATAGLRVDLGLLADPEVALWGVIVVVAATASKFIGALLGSRLAGLVTREGLALAVGLNARGAVEIVLATVGLSIGVLNAKSYAVVVLMAVVTSVMAPPLLRALLRDWPGSEEEQERLARERALGGNVLVRPTRILLPTHGGPNSVLAARIADQIWPEGQEATVLAAGRDVPQEDVADVRAAFVRRPARYEHVSAGEPLAAILHHARLGYGAIALGATDTRQAGTLISPLVDELLGASPLPVLMVRRGENLDPLAPLAFRRILVPSAGTTTGRAAQEVAFGLARQLGAKVLVAHVVSTPSPRRALLFRRADSEDNHVAASQSAERVVEEARALALELGARAETEIRVDPSVPDALLAMAREHAADLVVLGASLRQFSGRPFLGHGTEYLLEQCRSTILVVTLPPGWSGAQR